MATTSASASGKPDRPPTPFEEQVYAACRRIPPGRVASYGVLAASLGKGVGCARSVGAAMRRNPYAPSVPWHRVVAADGSIGGFSGQWGQGCKIDKKRALLQSEGVQFDDKTGKIVKDCMLTSIPEEADDNDGESDAKNSSARPAKRQKTERNTNDNGNNKKTSKYFATKAKGAADCQEASSADTTSTIDTELRGVTLQMIDERAAGKTCWPSEIPRRLAKWRGGNAAWRDWMPNTHQIVKVLAKEGRLEITQKGSVVDANSQIRRPYRIRKVARS